MAQRVFPQTTQGSGGYDYGYNPGPFRGGYSRVGGQFGPDTEAIGRSGRKTFNQLYSEIADKSDRQSRDRRQEKEKADAADRLFGALNDIGEGIAENTGIRRMMESDDPIQKAGGFLFNIPVGSVSAPISGAAELYEAVRGRGATDIQDDKVDNLDWNQRAAQGVNALIDVAEPFFGAESKLIGGASRLGKRGLAAAAKSLGSDMFAETAEKAASKAAKDAGKNIALEIGKDALGEGAEEFVQSLASDVRDKQTDEGSLGRAFEAAGYGALAGGIASGAGQGLNWLAARGAGKKGTNGPETESMPAPSLEHLSVQNGPTGERRYVTPSVRSYAESMVNGSGTLWPASSSVTIMQPDTKDFKVDDMKLGTEDVRSLWEADDRGKSSTFVEDTFGMTHDEASKMFSMDDWEDRLIDRYSAVLQDHDVDGYWARNPATKGRQPVKAHLRGLFKGSGIMLHPMVLGKVGADVDGDKSFVTINTDATRNAKYASDLLFDPETGIADLDDEAWRRSGISRNVRPDTIMSVINDVMGSKVKSYETTVHVEDAGEVLKFENSKNALHGNHDKLYEVSKMISDGLKENDYSKVRDGISEVASISQQSGFGTSGVAEDIIYRLSTNSESSIVSSVESAIKNIAKAPEVQAPEFSKAPGIPSSGTTPKRYTFAQMAVDYDRITYALSQSGNSVFRQFGEMGFQGKSAPSYLSTVQSAAERIVDLYGSQIADHSKRTQFIVALLHETYRGGDVENAIEGKLSSYVASKVITGRVLKNGGRISTEEDMRSLAEEFVEAYNESVKIAEDAKKILTGDGWEIGYAEVLRSPIDPKGDILSDESFLTSFERIMGFCPMNVMFDTHNCPDIADMSIGEVIEMISDNPVSSGQELIGLGKDMNSFFQKIKSNRGHQVKMVSSMIRNQIKKATLALNKIVSRISDGHVSDVDLATSQFFLDMVNQIVGVKESFEAGIYDYSTFVSSAWGKMLISGDESLATRSIISMAAFGEWKNIVDLSSAAKTQAEKNYVIQLITQKSHIPGGLHAYIASEMIASIEKGGAAESQMLRNLIDLNISLESLESNFKDRFDTKDGRNDLLVSVLTHEDSEFDLSDVTARARKAMRSLKSGLRSSYDEAMRQVGEVEKMLADNEVDEYTFCRSMEELASECVTEIDNSAMASMIYDAANFGNKSIEKATIESAAQGYGQSMEIYEHGAIMAETDIAINEKFRRVPLDKFVTNRKYVLAALSGKMEFIVYDPSKPGSPDRVVDRASFFGKTGTPTANDWISLFRKSPHLVGLIAPHKVMNIVSEGQMSTRTGMSRTLSGYLRGRAAEYDTTGSEDKTAKRYELEAKRTIYNDIRTIPGLPALVVQMIDNIDAKLDPVILKNEIDTIMKTIVNVAYNRALISPIGDKYAKITGKDALANIGSVFKDTVQATIDAEFISRLRTANSQAVESMSGMTAQKAIDSMYKMGIETIARKAGITISFEPQGINGMDEIVESASANANAISEDLGKSFDQLIQIYKLIIEFTDDAGSGIDIDPELISEYRNKIDAAKDVDDAKKRELKRYAENFLSMVDGVIDAKEDVDIMTDGDFVSMDKDVSLRDIADKAIEKAKRIYADTSYKYPSDMDAAIELAVGVDSNGQLVKDAAKIHDARRKVKLEVDSVEIQKIVSKLRLDTDARINPNILRAYVDVQDVIRDIDKTARDAITNSGKIGEGTRSTKANIDETMTSYPVINVVNPVAQSIVSKLNATDVPASLVATETGVNGINYRTYAGFAALDNNRVCNHPPKIMSAGQLFIGVMHQDLGFDLEHVHIARPLENFDYAQWSPEGRGKYWKLDNISNDEAARIASGTIDPTTIYYVFDPNDCEDGLCVAHQENVISDKNGGGYLSVPNIINRINQHAQEFLNIKMKKRPGMLSVLGTQLTNAFQYSSPVEIDVSPDGTPSADSVKSMDEMFKKMRIHVSDELTRWLGSDKMAPLGYGRVQADQLSRVMVQGLKVTMNDGSQAYVRGSIASSAEAFKSWVENLREKSGNSALTPIMAEESVFTLDELSMRGMMEAIRTAGPDYKREDVQRAVLRGMTDLSSLKPGSLSMSEIASQIAPSSMAFDVSVAVGATPSQYGSMLDVMSGSNVHSIVNPTMVAQLNPISEDQRKAVNELSEFLRASNGSQKLNIYRAIGSLKSSSLPAGGDDAVLRDLATTVSSTLRGIGNDDYMLGGSAILLDPSRVDEAVSWSMDHRQPFFVPYRIAQQIKVPMPYAAGREDVVVNGSQVALLRYNPSIMADKVGLMDRSSVTSKLDTSFPDVFATMPSTPGMMMSDAGSLINADTAGYITTEHDTFERVPVSRYTQGVKGRITRLASADDLAKLVELADDGTTDMSSVVSTRYMKNVEKIPSGVADASIEDFIEFARNGGVVKDSAMPGDVITMLVTERNDGSLAFSPVFIGESEIHDKLRNVSVSKFGGDLYVSYDSRTDFGDRLRGDGNPRLYAHKINPKGIAYKSMGIVIDPGKFAEVAGSQMPKTNVLINGENSEIDTIIDSLALGTRVVDKGPQIQLDNMWWFSHGKMMVNMFVKPDENGKMSLSPEFKKVVERDKRFFYGKDGNGTGSRLVDMLSGQGDNSVWLEAVEAGKFYGFCAENGDDSFSRIMENLIRRCADKNISFLQLVSNMYISDDQVIKMLSDKGPGLKLDDVKAKPANIDYELVLSPLAKYSRSMLLKFFNEMDSRICQRDIGAENDGSTVFDVFGNTYVDFGVDPSTGKKVVSREPVIWSPINALDKSSQLGSPSRQAKRGAQMRASQAYDNGMPGKDTDFFVEWFCELTNRPDIIEELRKRDSVFPKDLDEDDGGYLSDPDMLVATKAAKFSSIAQRLFEEKLHSEGEVYDNPLAIVDIDGETQLSVSDIYGNPDSATAIDALNNALLGDANQRSGDPNARPLTFDEIMMLFVNRSGQSSYGNRSNVENPTIVQFTRFVNEMARNVRDHGLPIVAKRNIVKQKDRYPLALIPIDLAHTIYRISPTIRARFSSEIDFKDAMMRENDACIEEITNIKDKAKRNALLRLSDWTLLNWGEQPATGHIYANVYLKDMIASNDIALKMLSDYMFTPEQVRWFRENSEKQAEKIARIAKFNDTGRYTTVDMDGRRLGYLRRYDRKVYSTGERFLRNASELSRFMAMCDPFISAANIIDRVVHQGTTNAVMAWCMDHGFGPYKSNIAVNQDIVKMGADSEDAKKVFDMFRFARYDGDEAIIMSNLRSLEDVDAYLREREDFSKNDKLFFIPRNWVNKVFEWSGGGDTMGKYQRRNWFNQFMRIISSDDFNRELNGQVNPLLSKSPGSDVTIAENMWAENPAQFMIQVFRMDDNPYHSAARRALEFSRAGEASQANILSTMMSTITKRSSVVEFFTTTCVSRFFLYATNMTGRIVNLVAPVSALNYLAVDLASKTKLNEDMGFSDIQIYTSLREALAVDAMHMAPGVLAMLLAAIKGALTPPDDEDKRGIYDEWLFFGHRIGEDWLLSDTLGVFGPLACFYASLKTGDVRFDLLFNGIAEACYNNPILKATSAVEMLFDPESSFMQNFEEDAKRYKDAPGGAPDALDWLGGRAFSGALAWGSQFITPSVVRNITNSYEADRYERAYRYKIATDARGEQIIDPDTGMPKYQETSYLDAQIRRVSRTNPMIGLLADVITGAWVRGDTGYTRWEQPRTVYYDDAQLECMKMLSVNDENGNPLPTDQQQEKIFAVLYALMSTDDMDALCATGFYLDYDTKMMVGDTIHDIIQTMRDDFSNMKASGFFDYYYGGLSYDEGRERAETLKAQYYDELNFWQSMYYDKLWSEPMKRPLAMYNRYNTAYRMDANGDFYATGIYNSVNPLYHSAPGTLDNPASTAGYDNDWKAISAVTGKPMDQRALEPVEQGYLETPDLESLGDESNGGYSTSFPGWSYRNSANDDGYGNSNGGYGRSRGGYGWRSYGRGGRGGGSKGGSPNIYSKLPSVNMPGAKTMYAERLNDPQFDYLRPNFETKGSREAYKRSDI